jgi:carboxyl-terminal processing protease
MKFRSLFLVFLLSANLLSISSAWSQNSREFLRGYGNFTDVINHIVERYDDEVDVNSLIEGAWVSVKAVLPDASAALFAANIAPHATSQEAREHYTKLIEDSIIHVARSQNRDATPTVTDYWNAASAGLVNALEDSYSQFLPPQDRRELEQHLSGETDESERLYGVGISVDWDTESNRGLLVIAPLLGSPADRAGIRAGDLIISVDGKSLEQLNGSIADRQDKAISMVRGEEGAEVTLTIERQGLPEPIEYTLARAPINERQHVLREMLDDEVGYIRLVSFYANASRDLRDAMRYLRTEGMQKLILDLRYNPGGYLDQAVKVADLFLPRGELITYTKGRNSELREFRDNSNDSDGFLDIPLVILMNKYSASASEVVTGALKDNHRAIVIGQTSFGKGSVQEVFGLRSGAGLRLTVARYYTPSGVCIHEEGIEPDIEVGMPTEEDIENIPDDLSGYSRLERRLFDPQLRAAYRFHKGEVTIADRGLTSESESGT